MKKQNNIIKWTRFHDMRSGGNLKENYNYIYIEAPQSEAEVIFYNRFGHNPNRVSCTCCGEDYAIEEYDSLELARKYDKVDHGGSFLIINASDIKSEERIGEVPEQGYIWH